MMIQLGRKAVTLEYGNSLGYRVACKVMRRVARGVGVAGDGGTFTYSYKQRLGESDVYSYVLGGEENESSQRHECKISSGNCDYRRHSMHTLAEGKEKKESGYHDIRMLRLSINFPKPFLSIPPRPW